jgi:hypothetical protein
MHNAALFLVMMTAGLPQGRTAARSGAQAAAVQAVNGSGTLLADAPMFLFPDNKRTPLASLPAGTIVRVTGREGVWYQVIYHDAFLGDRTGYIEAANIRYDAVASPPGPAPDTRGAPGVAAPQRPAPRPPARPAPARRPPSWSEHGYVSLNLTYQTTSNAFTAATTFTQNVETGNLTTTYDLARPPVLDFGAMERVWRNLAVGVAVTWLSQSVDGDITASIPHPFVFNAPRTVTGSFADLPRDEFALHIDAGWIVPVGRKTEITIFGGPSFFQVKQGLVIGVTTSSVYPYDTATFVSAITVDESKSRVGFNAGVDVTFGLAKHIGVGAIVRYSHASLEFPVSSGSEVTVRAGGAQIGGGLRVGF